MTLICRGVLLWVLVALGPLAWVAQQGLELRILLPSAVMTSGGSNGFRAPVPIPTRLLDAPDDSTTPPGSALHLFENGRELGPGHSSGQDVDARGHGAFSHWGHALYFSSSDGTSPITNGRVYSATLRVFPTPAGEVMLLVVPSGIIAVVCLAFLLARKGITADRLRSSLSSLLLLRNRIAACRLKPGLSPRSFFEVIGLSFLYAAALAAIHISLLAQNDASGQFKINFEYKIF